jgi:hypothetical protein
MESTQAFSQNMGMQPEWGPLRPPIIFFQGGPTRDHSAIYYGFVLQQSACGAGFDGVWS